MSRLTFEGLVGRTILDAGFAGTAFTLRFDDATAVLRARAPEAELLTERGLTGEDMLEPIDGWVWLAGRRIVAVHAVILAEDHVLGEPAPLRLDLDNGQMLVLRALESHAPVVLAEA